MADEQPLDGAVLRARHATGGVEDTEHEAQGAIIVVDAAQQEQGEVATAASSIKTRHKRRGRRHATEKPHASPSSHGSDSDTEGDPALPAAASLRRHGRSRRPPPPSLLSRQRSHMQRWYRGALGRLCALTVGAVVVLLLSLLIRRMSKTVQFSYAEAHFDWQTGPPGDLRSFAVADSNNGSSGVDDPTAYPVRLDGHSHTTRSDGRLSPAQLLEWAIAHGYNAIIVTDHNGVGGGLETEAYALKHYPNNITVIPGQEYSCCRIHMNLIGIRETVMLGGPEPTDDDLREIIRRTHVQGGLAVVNHIFWSNRTVISYQEATLPNHPSRERLVELGVDGFEVVNGDTLDYPTLQWLQRQRPNSTVSGQPIFAITGSDIHFPDGAYGWTLVRSEQRTVPAIMAALRAGHTRLLYDPAGTRPRYYIDRYTTRWSLLSVPMLLGSFAESLVVPSTPMYSFQNTFCQPQYYRFHGMPLLGLLLTILVVWLAYELVRGLVLLGWRQARQTRKRMRRARHAAALPV